MKNLLKKITQHFTPKVCGLTKIEWEQIYLEYRDSEIRYIGICNSSQVFAGAYRKNKFSFQSLAFYFLLEAMENRTFYVASAYLFNRLGSGNVSSLIEIRLQFISYIIQNFNELWKKY